LATGFCSVSYCNATKCRKCPVFLMRWIDKNGPAVPRWETVSGRKDLQYRFAIEMNRFNRGRSASSPGNHDQTATIDFHRPDVRFRVAGGNRWACSRESYNNLITSASPSPNCSRDCRPPAGRSARRRVPQPTSKCRNRGQSRSLKLFLNERRERRRVAKPPPTDLESRRRKRPASEQNDVYRKRSAGSEVRD
jgi:hypothetical protein